RFNEICFLAIHALEHLIVGRDLASMTDNMGKFWREFTSESQLRWIGTEKGAIHMATGAVINAVWDLWSKAEGKTLWR
ncbi:fuconate dehydratase, partial [Yersinia pestis]|nr:fuconate dehydratase [Yersinia pestis]